VRYLDRLVLPFCEELKVRARRDFFTFTLPVEELIPDVNPEFINVPVLQYYDGIDRSVAVVTER